MPIAVGPLMEEEGMVDEDTEEEVFEDDVEDEGVAVESVEEEEANVDVDTEAEADELEVADDADVLVDDKDEVTNADVMVSSSSSSSSSPSLLFVGDGLADVDDVDADDVDKAVDVDAVVSSSSASSSSSVANGSVGAAVGGEVEVVDVDEVVSSSSSSSPPFSSASVAGGLLSVALPGGSCVGSGSPVRMGAVTLLPMSSSPSSSSDRKSCTSCGLRTNIRLLPRCCERALILAAPG